MRTKIIPPHLQNISIESSSRTFLGEALFETIKVIEYKGSMLKAHWLRMKQNAGLCKIPFSMSFEDWEDLIKQAITSYNLKEGGLKIVLGSGQAKRGLKEITEESLLWTVPVQLQVEQNPLVLKFSPWKRDKNNPVYSVKSINYLESILGQRFAKSLGVDDLLYLSMDDCILETSTANFFLVLDGVIFTPPLSDGILPGVTRAKIIETAYEKNMSLRELSIPLDWIARADAAFITNSLSIVRSVKQINDKKYSVDHSLIHKLLGAPV